MAGMRRATAAGAEVECEVWTSRKFSSFVGAKMAGEQGFYILQSKSIHSGSDVLGERLVLGNATVYVSYVWIDGGEKRGKFGEFFICWVEAV